MEVRDKTIVITGGSRGIGAAAAKVLRADLDALGLQNLAYIQEAGEVFRLRIVTKEVVVDDRVAFVVFLMCKQHRGKDICAILGLRERIDRSHLGK